jgi:hypothetical protein
MGKNDLYQSYVSDYFAEMNKKLKEKRFEMAKEELASSELIQRNGDLKKNSYKKDILERLLYIASNKLIELINIFERFINLDQNIMYRLKESFDSYKFSIQDNTMLLTGPMIVINLNQMTLEEKEDTIILGTEDNCVTAISEEKAIIIIEEKIQELNSKLKSSIS